MTRDDETPATAPSTSLWSSIHRNIGTIKDYAELMGAVLVLLGGIMAYLQYVDGQRKEQEDLGERAYAELQDSYFEFLQICLQYPELDCYDRRPLGAVCLTENQERQQTILYAMIVSVFERAFVRYEVSQPPRRAQQWPGWVKYMEGFADREGLRAVWADVRDEYDAGFQVFFDGVLQRVPVAKTPACTPIDAAAAR